MCADCWQPKEAGAFAPRVRKRAPEDDGGFWSWFGCSWWPFVAAGVIAGVAWISA